MKKVLAILIAVLMLLSAGALAEGNAAIMTVDNLRLESGGQTATIPGLSATLALVNVDDLPSIALLVDGDGQPLATAALQLTSRQVRFAIDGMDHGYYEDMPEQYTSSMAQFGDAGMAILVPSIAPMLDSVIMPPFTGVDIPKLDIGGVLDEFVTNRGAGSYDFEIPYEKVNELLDQLLELARTQGQNISNIDEAAQALEEMKASGMGIALKGTVTDDGATLDGYAGVYLAMNGTVTDQEVARLTITSRQNDSRLTLSVSENGASTDVMTLSLTSDPSTARLDFVLDVTGNANLTFSLYNEDSLQKAAFLLNSPSDNASFVFAYGQQAGTDVVSFDMQGFGSDMSFAIKTVMGSDNVRTGTMTLDVSQDGEQSTFTGDVTMRSDAELDMSGFTMPSTLRPFSEFDSTAASEAFATLSDYVSSHAQMG